MKSNRQTNKQSEKGMVSLMMTMVMMLIISIIVIGFAQTSRREQSQSLDRHLSTQAFLAAESGVNDARKIIQSELSAGRVAPEHTDCRIDSDPASPYAALNPVVDVDTGAKYTCLLVKTTLTDITRKVSANGTGVTVPLHASGNIGRLHIEWSTGESVSATNLPNCVGGGNLPKSGNWQCPYGLLRIDMVKTTAGSLDRNSLKASQKAFYLMPRQQLSGPIPVVSYGSDSGIIKSMACTYASCKADITGIAPTTDYALRLSGVYTEGTIKIVADDGSSAIPLSIQGAQAEIDVTGKAQDVLRRIQVRVALAESGGNADYALVTGSSICKRFSISDDSFEIPNDNIVKQDQNNPMCKPISAP